MVRGSDIGGGEFRVFLERVSIIYYHRPTNKEPLLTKSNGKSD